MYLIHVIHVLFDNYLGVVSNYLLSDFKSPLMDDADGSLWFTTALLTQINDLIKSTGQNYGVMDYQSVHIIKTTLPFIMELLVHPVCDNQQGRIANHIAHDKELMDTLFLILQGHGRELIHHYHKVFMVQTLPYNKEANISEQISFEALYKFHSHDL